VADDEVIRIGTSVDISGLRDGMAQAVQVNKASLDKLRSDYAAAVAGVQAATAMLASAQSALADSSRSSDIQRQQAVAILAQYETELKQAVATEAQSAAALEAMNAALFQETVAATEATVAQTAHAASLGKVMSATTEARYATQLLGRDLGVGIPRAISTIVSQSEQLGPVFAAAFPVAIAGYMGIELGKLVVKGYDLYDNWMNLKEASNELLSATRKTFESIERDLDATNRATEEYLRLAAEVNRSKAQTAAAAGNSGAAASAADEAKSGIAAADNFRIAAEGQKQVDPSKLLDFKKLSSLTNDIQDSIGKAFAPGPISEAAARFDQIGTRLSQIKEQLADFNPMGGKTKKDLEVEQGYLEDAAVKWKAVADRYAAESQVDQARFQHDQAEAVRAGTEEQLTAYRKREQQLAQADQEAMSALEVQQSRTGVTGNAAILQKLALLAQELAGETAYSDRVRQLHAETAKLDIESANEFYRGQRAAMESGVQLPSSMKKLSNEESLPPRAASKRSRRPIGNRTKN
jgi:hypothetical protein